MSDAIRQAAEGCTSEIIVSSGIMSLPDRMADIIERAMRKLLDAQLEQVSSWMTEHSFATGHGDTVADLLKELNWQMAERVAQAFSDGAAQHEKVWGAALMNEIANLKAQQAERVKEAVEGEREACAKVAYKTPFRCHAEDDGDFHSGCVQTRDGIVDAIRSRGDKEGT